VTLVCAAHPNVDAIARCVRCGVHLCASCRTLEGARNFCSRCRADLRRYATPTSPVFASAIAVPPPLPAAARVVTPRSPTLAAFLSLVPGLGQAYCGRWLRGALFFATATTIHRVPWATLPIVGFLYVFNLFDAYRIAQLRVEAKEHGSALSRFDDTLFLAVGVVTLAATVLVHGGFAAAPHGMLVQCAAIAAGLLVAHETRR
jgi:hypothetical protein